jgi:hypothetical protein
MQFQVLKHKLSQILHKGSRLRIKEMSLKKNQTRKETQKTNLLKSGEVPTTFHLVPPLDVIKVLCPSKWWPQQLVWIESECCWLLHSKVRRAKCTSPCDSEKKNEDLFTTQYEERALLALIIKPSR